MEYNMEYKDSPPPYQQMPSPEPGFQNMPPPPPGFQNMPPPPPVYQSSPSPFPTNSVIVGPMFRDFPLQVTCGNCGQSVMSTVIKSNGVYACVAAAIVLAVCFPCFWVPLVMDSCKDHRHVCPSCHTTLGVYKKKI